MGTAASNEQRVDSSNVDNTRTKMAAVAAFKTISKSKTTSTHTKEDIYEFVRKQKALKEESWQSVQTGKNKRSLSLLPEEKPREDDHVYEVTEQDEDNLIHNICGICGICSRLRIDGFPCRVCGQVFHRECIAKDGRYSAKDVKMFERAKTPVGWSCEPCDNICDLLSTDEVNELAESFDEFDTNKDATVSLSEFLAYKKHTCEEINQLWTAEEEEFQKFQFRRLDEDGSGEIDYWEFVKHESCRRLSLRSKDELVKLLTPLEKLAAKRMFNILDIDKDGVIEEDEARMAYRSWYGHLNKLLQTDKKPSKADSTGAHKATRHESNLAMRAKQHADMIFDMEEGKDWKIDWRDFLQRQALYILSSRPNKTNIGA